MFFIFISFLTGFYKNYTPSNNYTLNSKNNIQIISFYNEKSHSSEKIAPGTAGKFIITVDEDMSNPILLSREEGEKPKNLYFTLDNKRFNELSEVIAYINEKQLKSSCIEWIWEYKGNDIVDTKDGKNANEYLVEISVQENDGDEL